MSKEYQRWQMRALAAGYPLCVDCQQPIPKVYWHTLRRCPRCEERHWLYKGWDVQIVHGTISQAIRLK